MTSNLEQEFQYSQFGDTILKREQKLITPLNPNIKMQILISIPYTFSIEVVGRIFWSINKIHLVWSCPQFSWSLSLKKHWYNKEKFCVDHSQGLKG